MNVPLVISGLAKRDSAIAPVAALPVVECADEDLVEAAGRGDRLALEALAERYRGRLFAYAFGILRNRDEAEDVAQETLLRCCGQVSTVRRRASFRVWLFRIAGNLCRDRRRGPESRNLALDDLDGELAAPAEDLGEAASVRFAVAEAVSALPLIYRQPVLLHYFEGLSVDETARALGRSQTAVRVQLWRARQRLESALRECVQEGNR